MANFFKVLTEPVTLILIIRFVTRRHMFHYYKCNLIQLNYTTCMYCPVGGYGYVPAPTNNNKCQVSYDTLVIQYF